jgi:hypothetical protein
MDLGMALEIMLADEAFAASVAAILSVSEMGLNVGPDILSPSKNLAALGI